MHKATVAGFAFTIIFVAIILSLYFVFEGISFVDKAIEIRTHTEIYSSTEDRGSSLSTLMFLEKNDIKYTSMLAEVIFKSDEESKSNLIKVLKSAGLENLELYDDSNKLVLSYGEFSGEKHCTEIALPNLKRGKICLD